MGQIIMDNIKKMNATFLYKFVFPSDKIGISKVNNNPNLVGAE